MTEASRDVLLLKRELRRTARFQVSQISPEQWRSRSAAAVERLAGRPEFLRAQRLLGYLALKDELDMAPALEVARRAGQQVALPRFVPEEKVYCAALLSENFETLLPGAFGILEPPVSSAIIPLNQLDFVLVPGVAFDLSGRRLGRGKGFYDRLLANVNSSDCIKCGIAADEQIVAGIPAEPHDISMDLLLTPTRCLVMTPG